MDFKRYKKFLNPKLLLFAIVVLIFISNPIQVHASSFKDWATSIVNGTGSGNSGGNTTIQNGVKYTRTGYLCYLLTKDGADTGLPAKAYKSPGFEYLSGASMIATSRRGHTVSSFENVIAPWNVTPWTPSDSGTTVNATTNAPQIKAYFESMEGNSQNGVQFVYDNWGEEAATRFTNDEYVLVIETLMHFQYSKPSGASASLADIEQRARDIITILYFGGDPYADFPVDTMGFLKRAISYGYQYSIDDWSHMSTDQQRSVINSIKNALYTAVKEVLMEQSDEVGAGARTFVGPPLIGTVPNLIDFKNSTDPSMIVFDSYLNKVAPLAERIEYDEAGFITYTGSTSNKLPDSSILGNNGVAMLIIHANSQMQTTCNEPSIPSPHEPPKESEGKVTIVKSYRTKDPTGTLIDDGTYSTPDLGTQILIENEQVYQVIGWKTSTTTNTGISSLSWESSVPSSVVQQGTTPKSVTLEPTETCLYVLLEKVEDPEVEEMEWNYHLTQSQITRTVWFS